MPFHAGGRIRAVGWRVAACAAAVSVLGSSLVEPAEAQAEPVVPAALTGRASTQPEAPGPATPQTPEAVSIESWTPSTHTTSDGESTTMEVFAQPAFKRSAEGWESVDPAVTAGTGEWAFEALGLVNPVHFGTTAERLMTIDGLGGEVVFSLPGAQVSAPTLGTDGAVVYTGLFPGVDLELRTEGGRLGKRFILADSSVQQSFEFVVSDTAGVLGEPVAGDDESWSFSSNVAFESSLSLPAPAAWSVGAVGGSGVAGSAHQVVATVDGGYTIDLSLDPEWATTAQFPVVLDPAVVWTDETWTDEFELEVAFAPIGATTCDGGPCLLADPVDGSTIIGDPQEWEGLPTDLGYYLTYVGADVSSLVGREITDASVIGDDYWRAPETHDLCARIDSSSTGADLAAARCGDPKYTEAYYLVGSRGAVSHYYPWWSDVTDSVQAAVAGEGPTGTFVGFAIGHEKRSSTEFEVDPDGPDHGAYISPPGLRLVYERYPVPRPLRVEQTFGCDCWGGTSTGNQALAADPVNTATGSMVEQFDDLPISSVGQSINIQRTYNSLDPASGPFGPGWSFAYGMTLIPDAEGNLVFRDGSGTQMRFAPLVGGGYAPLDPAISANLTDGDGGTRVLRNLRGETLTFGPAGQLVASADRYGKGLSFAYTAGNLTEITDSLGQSATLAWDQTGGEARLVSVDSSDGRRVEYGYTDTAGARRLTTVKDVAGATTTFAYDPATGGISQILDPLGNVRAQNTYDAATGRITSQTDQIGAVTTFTWDDATQTATVTDPTGVTRQDIYSGLNLIEQIDGAGVSTEILYDGDNNASAFVQPSDDYLREDYDDRDRLVQRVGPAPDFFTERWEYDDNDLLTSYCDADSFCEHYEYDSAAQLVRMTTDTTESTFTYTTAANGVAGLLASSTDGLGRTTSYGYSSVGDLVSVTSPAGGVTAYAYDNAHRMTSVKSPMGAVTSYTYDAAGRQLTSIDAAGGVAESEYDAAGWLVRQEDSAGRWTEFTYDAAGRTIGTLSSSGATSTTEYDDAGRVIAQTNALGGVTEYEYDSAGRPVTTLDAAGGESTLTYDVQGRVATQTGPGGGVTSFSYNASGRVTQRVDPDGVIEQYWYDARGNLTGRVDAEGNGPSVLFSATGQLAISSDGDRITTWYEYDAADQLVAVDTPSTSNDRWSERQTMTYDLDGRLTAIVDPRGNLDGVDPADFTTTFAYDADGREISTTDALGNTSSTAYDVLGRPTTVTDPAGGTTTRVYDQAGNVITAIDQVGAETHFTYDLAGNLTALTNALGNATGYTYDVAGNLLSQTDALARTSAAEYDAAGRVISSTAPSGVMTAFGYDTAGRKSSITYSDGSPAVDYTYTPAGRHLTATRAGDGIAATSTTYGYDAYGRTVTVDTQSTTPMTATYTYTGGGRIESAAWSTGAKALYQYNAAGTVSTVTTQGAGTVPDVSFDYDASGRPTTVTRSSLVPAVTSYTYDQAGRLTGQSDSVGAAVLTSYRVERDARGFPVSVTNDRAGLDPLAPTVHSATTYTYDLAGRVTGECSAASGLCDDTSPQSTYTYDALGNRASRTLTADTGGQPALDIYAYDAANQLLAVTTDNTPTVSNTWSTNGTLETSTTPQGTRTYSFGTDGRLAQVDLEDGRELGYGYDPNGNRTARTIDGVVDTSWTWDASGGVPVRTGEYDATGTLTTAWLPDPTSATGGLLASTDAAGNASWLLTDPFSNVVAEATTDGTALLEGWDPDLFGRVLDPAAPSPALGFDGQYQDDLTGLYDLRAREYDPRTGQFLSADPMRAATGDPADDGHSYSFNNPLVFSDVTGLWPDWDQWLENTSNFSAGFGDAVTFGGTAAIRELINYEVYGEIDDMVDNCSGSYMWGSYTSAGVVLAAGGPAAIKSVQSIIKARKVAQAARASEQAVNAARAAEAAEAAKVTAGLADDVVASAYQGMRSEGGHAIRHLRDEGLIANSGSLSSQVAKFEQLTKPILQSPTKVFDWRVGETMTQAFAGEAGGRQVVVFIATEGPYKGSILSAVVPDAVQMAQWGLL